MRKEGSFGRLLSLGIRAVVPTILVILITWTIIDWCAYYLGSVVQFSLSLLRLLWDIPTLDRGSHILLNIGALIVLSTLLVLIAGFILTKQGARLYETYDEKISELKFIGKLYQIIKENTEFYFNIKGFLWKTAIIPRWNGVGYEFAHAVLLSNEKTMSAVASGNPDALVDIYGPRVPNITSGYPLTMRLGDVIVTDLPPAKFATRLGSGCAEVFEPYITEWVQRKKQSIEAA